MGGKYGIFERQKHNKYTDIHTHTPNHTPIECHAWFVFFWSSPDLKQTHGQNEKKHDFQL